MEPHLKYIFQSPHTSCQTNLVVYFYDDGNIFQVDGGKDHN